MLYSKCNTPGYSFLLAIFLPVQVFMLPSDAVLNEATLRTILESGHSRVPVHRPGKRWPNLCISVKFCSSPSLLPIWVYTKSSRTRGCETEGPKNSYLVKLTLENIAEKNADLDLSTHFLIQRTTRATDNVCTPCLFRVSLVSLERFWRSAPHPCWRRGEILGLILVKELVLHDKNAEVTVADLVMRSLPYLRADTPLYDMLKVSLHKLTNLWFYWLETLDYLPDMDIFWI